MTSLALSAYRNAPVIPINERGYTPTFNINWDIYPQKRRFFGVALVIQAAVSGLLALWVFLNPDPLRVAFRNALPIFVPNLERSRQSVTRQSGGLTLPKGGGGSKSKLAAGRGALPPRARKVFKHEPAYPRPKLATLFTIEAPPQLALPDLKLSQFGDPLSKLIASSLGPGSGGGIGDGKGGGVGPGTGGGSGKPFAGGGVIPPRLKEIVDPAYTKEALDAQIQGVVILQVEITTSGNVRGVRVLKGLGYGLDQKALEAVEQWLFEPAKLPNGKPVSLQTRLEVHFRLD